MPTARLAVVYFVDACIVQHSRTPFDITCGYTHRLLKRHLEQRNGGYLIEHGAELIQVCGNEPPMRNEHMLGYPRPVFILCN